MHAARSDNLRQQYLQRGHGLANIGYIALMHAALVSWLWSGRALLPFAAFLAASVAICLVHQRILSEWFHEATHWNLLPSRRWNDWSANLLIGSFNGTRVSSNRPGHFRHHAVPEFFTPDDPDTRSAAAGSRTDLARGLFLDLCGWHALQAFARAATSRHDSPAGSSAMTWLVSLALLHGAGFAATVAAGRTDIYPLYFLTLLSLYPVANRFRLYAQHARLEANGGVRLAGSDASRTFHAGPLEQILLHSPMIMYHHEHHAWPSLPYRALRAISRPTMDPNVFGRTGFSVAGAVLGGLP